MPNSFFKNVHINTSIKVFLEKKLSEYVNIKFAYAIMNKKNPNNFIVISNKTEWFSVYIENNYQLIDPVLITALYRVTPFSWDENLIISSGLKLPKIFYIAKNYSVVNGYTFVLHDNYHNLAVLSLIMDENCNNDIEETIKIKKTIFKCCYY